MPIKFSKHAEDQIKIRKISKTLIAKTVYEPESILSSFKKRKLRQKKVGDKLLEVVTKTEGSRITVVTAYYLKEDINEN